MIPEYEKSFANHPKSEFWSLKNSLKPYEVTMNSNKKFWFNCTCGHEFEIHPHNIVQKNGWCPFCSYSPKQLCENNECFSCFNNSLASVDYSKYWSSKNELQPRQVFKNSHKSYIFNCPDCKHDFAQCVSHITRGCRCSYCTNRVLCANINCLICLNKSFASVEKSKYLHIDNNVDARQLFKNSAKKYKFTCDKCDNIFENRLSHVTSGVWCNKCRYKTEQLVYDKLIKIYSTLQRQYKVDWCKDIKHLPFDFVIEERKIIIEVDGENHFIQVAKWKTPEHNRKRDLYKMKCANENGFSIIRILQEDAYKNKYDWLNELCENIEKITNENVVQNIYMCKKDEYKDFELGI